MKSTEQQYLGYGENTRKSSHDDIITRFLNEMVGLFCYDIGSEFVVCRRSIDTVYVRYPLTNTYFIVRFDYDDEFSWHIVDGNSKDLMDPATRFDLSECVQYIRLHKYGHSMPAYLSYAAC